MRVDLCPGETTVILIIHIMSNPFFETSTSFVSVTCYGSCVLLGTKYGEILQPTEMQGRMQRENAVGDVN